ncbi:MAG: chorismate synthase [Bacteroidales bacterium]
MNSFGRLFRLNIFGESHGKRIGITLDGVPPGIPLDLNDFKTDIERRKPNLKGTTTRIEDDIPEIISGVYQNYTTGAPLTIIFTNRDKRPDDYYKIAEYFRPGHADFVASKKYKGFNDIRGGGHFSGRLTLPLVAAGVIAKKIIKPITVAAKIVEIGGSTDIEATILHAIEQKDSVGGIVECVAQNMPIGLGEPFFDSLESLLAHAVFSIPAVKGIEFGSGFRLARMFGSQANDLYVDEHGHTLTNHSGGIHGGISNGNPLIFRIVVKPTSSIGKPQKSYHFKNKQIESIEIEGRHDTCIVLRIPVILEAITACVIADTLLLANAYDKNIDQN